MELSYFLNALLKRKWLIIACTLVAVLAAAYFVKKKGKLYESEAQYSTGFTIHQVSLTNEGFNLYETDTKFNNVLEAFFSPKVIGMLSYDLMLHDLHNPSNAYTILNERDRKSGTYQAVNPERAQQILAGKLDSLELLSTFNPEERDLLEFIDLYSYDYYSLYKSLIIERITRTDYLSIVFRSKNPFLSAYVVNKIGEEFLRFYTSLSSTLTAESVAKISSIVQQKKKQVDSITENLRKEKVSQGNVDPVESNRNTQTTIANLQSRLVDEKAVYSAAYFKLQSINSRLEQLSNAAISTPVASLPALSNNEEIIRIKNKLRELALNKDDPKVADQIRKLQEDLKNKESSQNPGGLSRSDIDPQLQRSSLLTQQAEYKDDMAASDEMINYLNGEIKKYSSQTFGGSDVKINALQTEVEIATKEYSDIKSKYSQAEGFKQSTNINFRQTLVGQPAIDPQPSHLTLASGIAGVSMFAFTSLLIVLLELLDNALKSPSRFEHSVGLPLLSPVNRVNFKKDNLADFFNSSPEEKEKYPERGLFMRFLKKLRFEIEDSGKKVILITSTKEGEGKSTLVEALAYSLGMTNKKVLILDTNFSNNSLTREFEVEGSLEEFSFSKENPGFESFKGSILPTKIKLVDIIGCKGGDYTPDEILDKNNFLENIKVLKGNYDYILMEGASLNDHSDSRELSRNADGIIAVFSADSAIRQLDKESIQFLTHCGPQFLGCILNKVEIDNLDI